MCFQIPREWAPAGWAVIGWAALPPWSFRVWLITSFTFFLQRSPIGTLWSKILMQQLLLGSKSSFLCGMQQVWGGWKRGIWVFGTIKWRFSRPLLFPVLGCTVPLKRGASPVCQEECHSNSSHADLCHHWESTFPSLQWGGFAGFNLQKWVYNCACFQTRSKLTGRIYPCDCMC